MENTLTILENNIDVSTVKFILKGSVNTTTANKLQGKLDETAKDAYKKGCKRIILNMQDVKFLSSGGIRVLLMYFKICGGRGIKFLVENPSDNVKNVLGMVALNEMLLK